MHTTVNAAFVTVLSVPTVYGNDIQVPHLRAARSLGCDVSQLLLIGSMDIYAGKRQRKFTC